MKKFVLFILLIYTGGFTIAQNNVALKTWKLKHPIQLYLPAFANKGSIDGKKFDRASLLDNSQIDQTPATKSWPSTELKSDSLISPIDAPNQLIQLSGYISSDRWAKASLKLQTNAIYQLYLDGEQIKTQSEVKDEAGTIDLTLTNGKHQLLLKLISTKEELNLGAEITTKDSTDAALSWELNERRKLNIHDILEGKSIASAQISPSGNYVLVNYSETLPGNGEKQSYSKVYDLEHQKNVFVFRNSASYNAKWMPATDRLTYQVEKDGLSDVFVFDIKSGGESKVAASIKDLGSVHWSPNEDYIIYSRYIKADKPGDLKRVFGNDDRLPNFRDRYFLYHLDIKTGMIIPLTAGYLSANLQDIKPDGSKILFSTSQRDYSTVPFSKQDLYEMNIRTLQLDTIWTDKLYGGSCQYAPNGKQLLVSAGPESFWEIGVNVSKGLIPNSYDTQLFLYDLQSGKVNSLTYDFDPAVNKAYWAKNGKIYLSVNEEDFIYLYEYDLKHKTFSKIDLPVDVLNSIDYARNKQVAVFEGTSITSPEKLYAINLPNGQSQLLDFPKEEQFKNIQLGKTENWNFINKRGASISGRIYYPVNYDSAKKYPLIVYYYGGTLPVDRSFGGRYPKNTWAANGYMVYVLQPSGATGFGQNFSALHVNGWGRDAIDDIIEGTEQFLKAHPSADAENVGCIGASYGGFTTMLLQTRTKLFKTAIAHAGISSITSYWGEGYWGYSYSAGATKNSYPWNRKDVYVDNSPVYNADKFHNSILLLHGTADTNVPVGESLQYYAALKILGKDVEMVLIEGEDHHILNYEKRLKWHDTILSWFDKKLKNQPEHWEEMYPEKQL